MRVFSYVAVSAFLAMPAGAATLTYSGNQFSELGLGPGNVEASLVVDGPLTVGRMITAADILSWSITSLGRTLSQDDGATFVQIDLRIGSDGLPDAWLLAIEKHIEAEPHPEQWTTRENAIAFDVSLDNLDAFAVDDNCPNVVSSCGTVFSALREDPGTWRHEAAVIPLPPAAGLLATGLVGLGFMGWRRRSTQSAG